MERPFLGPCLAAAAVLLTGGAAAQDNSSAPANLAIADPVPVTTVATGHDGTSRITLPIHIDGKGPFPFVVDTGAERTVISRELAARLALPADGPVRINSIAGIAEVGTVIIPRLSYGHGERPSVKAPVLEGVDLGAQGLLGLDSLEDKRLVIDFRARRMQISDSQERVEGFDDPDAIVVRARSRFGQLILVDTQANGEKVHVILDTGTDTSIGNMALLHKLTRKRKLDGLRPIELTGVTGQKMMGGWNIIGKVRIGGVSINNLAVVFADVSPFKQLGLDDKPALLLGMDVLRRFDRLAVDFGKRKVHFLLPDGAQADKETMLASR